jgi:hypothetical protein
MVHLLWTSFWSGSHKQTPKSVSCFEDCLNVVAIPCMFELFRNALHIGDKH